MAISITSPSTSASSIIELVYGDDYYTADSRAITFSLTGFPSMVGATVAFIVNGDSVLSFACVVTNLNTITLELSAAQIATIGVGYLVYDLQATLANGHVVTVVKSGTLLIDSDVR